MAVELHTNPNPSRRIARGVSLFAGAVIASAVLMPTVSAAHTTASPPRTEAQDPQEDWRTSRRRALLEKSLTDARTLYERGEYEAAKDALRRARALDETNQEVQTLLNQVNVALGVAGSNTSSFGATKLAQQRILEDRARNEVKIAQQSGREKMQAEDFDGAIRDFDRALLIMDATEIDFSNMPAEVASMRQQAVEASDTQRRDQVAGEERAFAAALREERVRAEAVRREQVDNLLYQSQQAFRDRQFDRSSEFAAEAQRIEPNNAIAIEMVEVANKASRNDSTQKYWEAKVVEIQSMLEAYEELKIPTTEILSLDQEIWARASQRNGDVLPEIVAAPEDQALREQLHETPVGLSFTEENGGYEDVVRTLRQVTNVPIIITPSGDEVIQAENPLMVIDLPNPISLHSFLSQMTSQTEGLGWTVRNSVVQITSKTDSAGGTISHSYDVRDLVFPVTQFYSPNIRGTPVGEADTEQKRTGGELDEKISYVSIDLLLENIREGTGKDYWDGDSENVSLNLLDRGFILVKASPDKHKEIKALLNDLRRFSTSVVTVDSKFLTVTRNFLQEVGVDIRGLGGPGNKGTVATLDNVTNGLENNASRGLDNGGTGDPAANPSAGAFFNDGGDGDVRGRSENFFTQGLGSSLTPNGGLTAAWSLISDTQLNLILRAVEKRESAEVVNSQILTVRNRERGNVSVINQTAYVKDFDVEVAQAAFIADPQVDVIQDGVVLDVRPVISHDRHYIQLVLQPTVAELARPIPTFTTSLAGSTLPVTLQLPLLTVTQFSTTAKVPDGGSVLIGGLRRILTVERRAEVPLFAQLPIISFLFKQEGQADESRSLMVMVRANITDVREATGK